MKEKMKDIFWFPATVLFFIGILDVLRGFMHTFLLTWSATNIAQLDIANGSSDQVFLLGVFGISNFLTGFIYFLISRKARDTASCLVCEPMRMTVSGRFGTPRSMLAMP